MLFLFCFLSWLFRQSLVSAAVGFHCTDVKGKRFSGWIPFACKGRFCPKRHGRLTFSLSMESVLTSMDGEGTGGCETVIGCHGQNLWGFCVSFPSACPYPRKFYHRSLWPSLVWSWCSCAPLSCWCSQSAHLPKASRFRTNACSHGSWDSLSRLPIYLSRGYSTKACSGWEEGIPVDRHRLYCIGIEYVRLRGPYRFFRLLLVTVRSLQI